MAYGSFQSDMNIAIAVADSEEPNPEPNAQNSDWILPVAIIGAAMLAAGSDKK
jgi:hypothetical protein